MSYRRKHSQRKPLNVPIEQLVASSPLIKAFHENWTRGGYTLRKTRCYRRKNGSVTARLTYADRKNSDRVFITATGIRLQEALG